MTNGNEINLIILPIFTLCKRLHVILVTAENDWKLYMYPDKCISYVVYHCRWNINNIYIIYIRTVYSKKKFWYLFIEWCDIRVRDDNERELDKLPGRNKDHFRVRTVHYLTIWFLMIKLFSQNKAVRDNSNNSFLCFLWI